MSLKCSLIKLHYLNYCPNESHYPAGIYLHLQESKTRQYTHPDVCVPLLMLIFNFPSDAVRAAKGVVSGGRLVLGCDVPAGRWHSSSSPSTAHGSVRHDACHVLRGLQGKQC